MRVIFAAFSLILWALLARPAAAQFQSDDVRDTAEQIRGADLRPHFSGITHFGTYSVTRENTGAKHYTETTNSDGTVLYKEGPLRATGRWTQFGDRICYSYDQDEMTGGCFYVYKMGNCYFYYSNNERGRTSRTGIFWTAKSVKKGDVATCDPAIG